MAIIGASSSPKRLVVDAMHPLNVVKAESSRLDELDASMGILEAMKKTPDQFPELYT